MRGQKAVVEVEALGKSFGRKRVLEDLTFEVFEGGRLGLSGPNGSGKTTLVRCIAGTVTPSSGTVTVTGFPGGSIGARAVTGAVMTGERAFYQRLSGLRNLSFYAALRWPRDRDARADVQALVEELELGSFVRERVDRYSSGMLQQLGLARALVGKPGLLLLDEPTRSLDGDAIDRFWGALDRRPDLSVVIASHRRSDLDRCSDRLELG